MYNPVMIINGIIHPVTRKHPHHTVAIYGELNSIAQQKLSSILCARAYGTQAPIAILHMNSSPNNLSFVDKLKLRGRVMALKVRNKISDQINLNTCFFFHRNMAIIYPLGLVSTHAFRQPPVKVRRRKVKQLKLHTVEHDQWNCSFGHLTKEFSIQ